MIYRIKLATRFRATNRMTLVIPEDEGDYHSFSGQNDRLQAPAMYCLLVDPTKEAMCVSRQPKKFLGKRVHFDPIVVNAFMIKHNAFK